MFMAPNAKGARRSQSSMPGEAAKSWPVAWPLWGHDRDPSPCFGALAGAILDEKALSTAKLQENS